MNLAFLTALGVGGATIVGSVAGFLIKGISRRFSDIVMAFAAGVMLAASVIGLILPSLSYGGDHGLLYTVPGIFCGALFLNLLNRFVPHLGGLLCGDAASAKDERLSRTLLFVSAIAIHNLPEGIAAGVGFGSGDTSRALIIAGGIALHNIPEGMVIIAPMLAAGVSTWRTFACAMATGLVEVAGTLLGYASVNVASAILPFALAFAGGTMLYVIVDEMIPETMDSRGSTYAHMAGFTVMLILDALMGG